ncbi:unnamed protein product, partial [marine sediment metagenome]
AGKSVGVRLLGKDYFIVGKIAKKYKMTRACVIRIIVHDFLKKSEEAQ